jgi:ABC-type antimicrobial peptide transport system permease subunit
MEFLARRSMIQLSFTTLTLGVVSALALLLGAIGLYGVLSYVVASRTREIGVRMALGAERRQIRSMVLRQVGSLTVVGAAVGTLVALALGRAAGSLLFGIEGHDPWACASGAVLLGAVALVAGYLPARRAASVDPMVALRAE